MEEVGVGIKALDGHDNMHKVEVPLPIHCVFPGARGVTKVKHTHHAGCDEGDKGGGGGRRVQRLCHTKMVTAVGLVKMTGA